MLKMIGTLEKLSVSKNKNFGILHISNIEKFDLFEIGEREEVMVPIKILPDFKKKLHQKISIGVFPVINFHYIG